jgi:hypothetical protein
MTIQEDEALDESAIIVSSIIPQTVAILKKYRDTDTQCGFDEEIQTCFDVKLKEKGV